MSLTEQSIGTINIGLAGHTQVGKTTLARTLTKSKVGEILHHANSTTESIPQDYHALLATIWDCPGFQNAAQMLTFIEVKQKYPELVDKFRSMMKGDVTFDERAVESLMQCDVILYLGNLAITPDDSHKNELALTKSIQPRIVGVLTKAGPNEHLIEWQKLMSESGVENVVIFNAHWDKPDKIQQIYDHIYSELSHAQQLVFLSGLERFKSRQKELRHQACNFIADLVDQCRAIKVTEKTYRNNSVNVTTIREEMQKRVKERVARSASEFVKNTTHLYEIASVNSTISMEEIRLTVQEGTEQADVFSEAIAGGKKTLAPGAVAGAVIGGLFAGILSGGLGAPAGAALGAGIGSAISGMYGAGQGAGSAEGGKLTVEVATSELETIVHRSVALIWALTHHGYGFGSELSEGKVEELQKQVSLIATREPRIQWTIAKRVEIVSWSENILSKIETQ